MSDICCKLKLALKELSLFFDFNKKMDHDYQSILDIRKVDVGT
jgi:hypothetical protein